MIKKTLLLSLALITHVSAISIYLDHQNSEDYFSSNPSGTFTFEDVSNYEGRDYSAYFDAAISYWSGALTGYADSGYTNQGLTLYGGITSLSTTFSDPSYFETLGIGSFTALDGNSIPYASEGTIIMNTDQLSTYSDNLIFQVLVHEIGHSLGFDSEMWWYYDLYDEDSTAGQYGSEFDTAALARYQQEFGQPDATFVPVEISEGEGSDHSHWDQVNGAIDSTGRLFSSDIMTAFASNNPYMSETSLAVFEDIGYEVDYSYAGELRYADFAVPEPSTSILVLISATGFLLRRKRH